MTHLNKVGSEVTYYRPPTSNSAHLVVSTCTRPYLVWVNLLNEDVLRFEVPVDDSLAVQEANPLVCGEKSTTLASLVEAQYTSEMSVHAFQNSQLLHCGAVVALVRARRRMSMVHHKRHLAAQSYLKRIS